VGVPDRYPGVAAGAARRGLRPGFRVLVTGAASGIGLDIAAAFHAEGARVHVCDIDEATLHAASRLDKSVGRSVADVSRPDDVDRLFDDVADRLGGLDALVNNAAITGPVGRIETNDPADWLRTINVNLVGQFLCIRRALPMLREAGGGSIVNLSSIAGRLGFPLRTAYAASKWGIIGMTQSVAMEAGADNVRVNAILPGIVESPRQLRVQRERARALDISDAEMSERYVANVSLKRKVDAQEIADMAIYLCSDAGRSINGMSLGVCGNVETMRRG
jgi:NAD(P)-dependent dehydrogenase (short-subunit alcohol dehydrogenase family)